MLSSSTIHDRAILPYGKAGYCTVNVKVTVAVCGPVRTAGGPFSGVTATPIKRVRDVPLTTAGVDGTMVSAVAVPRAVKSAAVAGTVLEFALSRTTRMLWGAPKSVVTCALIVVPEVADWLVKTGVKL